MSNDADWWEYANKLTSERDALAARLAEAERAIAAALECVEDNDMHGAQVILGVAMRAADNGSAASVEVEDARTSAVQMRSTPIDHTGAAVSGDECQHLNTYRHNQTVVTCEDCGELIQPTPHSGSLGDSAHPLMLDGVKHWPNCDVWRGGEGYEIRRRPCSCGAADNGTGSYSEPETPLIGSLPPRDRVSLCFTCGKPLTAAGLRYHMFCSVECANKGRPSDSGPAPASGDFDTQFTARPEDLPEGPERDAAIERRARLQKLVDEQERNRAASSGSLVCPKCGTSAKAGTHEPFRLWCHQEGCPAVTRAADSAPPACDHKGHPDWISVLKSNVRTATKFCGDCGQYIRPPDSASGKSPPTVAKCGSCGQMIHECACDERWRKAYSAGGRCPECGRRIGEMHSSLCPVADGMVREVDADDRRPRVGGTTQNE